MTDFDIINLSDHLSSQMYAEQIKLCRLLRRSIAHGCGYKVIRQIRYELGLIEDYSITLPFYILNLWSDGVFEYAFKY